MSIARNTLASLAGALLQLAVTIFTVPVYLKVIGFERYGVIVVIWLLSDYFALFNLGVDRAAIHFVAGLRRSPAEQEAIVRTALGLAAAGGIAGALLMAMSLPPLLGGVMGVPPGLVDEAGGGLGWVAALLPLSVVGTVLAGLLQAEGRFQALAGAQLFPALLFQVLPLGAARLLGANLEVTLIAGAAARATLPLSLLLLRRRFTGVSSRSIRWVAPLLRYGLWTTATNILSPLLVNLDRFMISALLGPVAVGRYAVPLNLVLRVQLLPTALQAVLFPRLSEADPVARPRLAEQATLVLGMLLAPALLIGALLLDPFLRLWLGTGFTPSLTGVGLLLLGGAWFNSLAYIPFAALQASGRPDAVARLHVAEIVPFLVVLWASLHWLGVFGAALSWSLRATVDAMLMFHLAGMGGVLLRGLWFPSAALLAAIALAWMLPGWTVIPPGALLLAALGLWAWRAAPPSLRLRLARPVSAMPRR